MIRRALALLLAVLVAAGPAAGLDVAFSALSDATCGSSGGIDGLTFATVDAGQVAFTTGTGVYKHDGTGVSVVADGSTAVPNGVGNFRSNAFGRIAAIDGGAVYFKGVDDATGLPGVYRATAGSVFMVADTTTMIPMGPGTYADFDVPGAADGAVAFWGRHGVFPYHQGIYLDAGGGAIRIADTTMAVPGEAELFTNFEVPSVPPFVESGEVAFTGGSASFGHGIYQGSGGIPTRIVDGSFALPGGSGPQGPDFLAISPSLDAGRVAFWACEEQDFFLCITGKSGVYSRDGGPLQTIADRGTPVPEGQGNFTAFQDTLVSARPMVASDGGRTVFYAESGLGPGLYLWDGSARHKIVDATDSLLGEPVSTLWLAPDALEGDQLVFASGGSVYSADLGLASEPPPLVDAPVGTIVGWHESLAGTPALPAGWVELNGQTLVDAQSPYDGVVLPDLNGALGGRGRFLRGGQCSGALEDDGFQGHHHAFSCCAEYIDDGSPYYSDPNPAFNQTGYDLATITVGDVTTGIHGTVDVADETRPVNDAVVWILKTREGSLLPVGSVVAWHPDFDGDYTPALPQGWAPFDGTTMISDGGDYHGTTLPDWNGGGHFLRGGTTSTTGPPEPQAIQGHRHDVSHNAEFFFASNVLGSGDFVNDKPANLAVLDPIDGSHGPVRYGTETRPINMSVVWLLKTSAGPLPTGAILAWHPNLGATPPLPKGAVQVSGQTIDDALSPYDGETLPDLNGDRRFLRGGSVSGALQDDQFQGHRHAVLFDNSRYVEATNGAWGGGGSGFADDYTATAVATSAASDGVNGTPRPETETRPLNMSVVWLMKVWRPVEQVAISSPGASGSVLGGPGQVGGLDYAFSGAASGDFSAAYQEVAFDEAGPYLDSPGSIDFTLPSDPVQFWELDFDAGFTSVTLVFGYDDAGFAPFFNEGSLEVYRYVDPFMGCTPGADCDWVPLPVVSRDTVANTITVTTTGFSQFVLGGPTVPDSSDWLVQGTAQGGTVDVTVGAVSLQLATANGQSSVEVAQAIADAINGDGLLADSGVTAVASGSRVTITGGAGDVVVTDPGLTQTTPSIPALPIGWVLLLAGVLGVHVLRRPGRRPA